MTRYKRLPKSRDVASNRLQERFMEVQCLVVSTLSGFSLLPTGPVARSSPHLTSDSQH